MQQCEYLVYETSGENVTERQMKEIKHFGQSELFI